MAEYQFNDGWQVRKPSGAFTGFGAAAASTAVRLPHDALRDEERTADAPGGGATAYFPSSNFTYEKRFAVPEAWRGRVVRLEIEGAARRAQIFVNEEFVANRADAYARFFVDITPYLRFGAENAVRVEVRSGEDSRWYVGAGLHRPVTLHVDEPVHIEPDGIWVRTLEAESDYAAVEVEATVTNRDLVTHTVRIATLLEDSLGAEVGRDETPITLAPGERAAVRQRFHLRKPKLWGPSRPHMHVARIEVLGQGEARVQPFGIRIVRIDPMRGLRINDEAVVLRGACVHHDNGPLGGAAIGRAEERRVELLQKAGFNAIRAAHNPVSRAMLDAADRLGVLIIDEAFDMWTRFKTPRDYASEFPQWWESDLDAMIMKDRNHPSVIMYSIGNEIVEVGTPHGARWARRLAEHVRLLDPTRPVTNGVNAMLAISDSVPDLIAAAGGLNAAMADPGFFDSIGASDTASQRIEESSSVLDVLGLNYGEVRYSLETDRHPNRVVVGTESFTPQIGRLWPMVVANDALIGDFCWTGWDYLGEVGLGSVQYADDQSASGSLEREYPYLTAWSGDLDITGWRRPASYYREIVFGLRRDPYIAVCRPENHGREVGFPSPWAWSDCISSWTWPEHVGAPVTIEVYTDADFVRLFLDGEELATSSVGDLRPFVAMFDVDYRPGVLTAVAERAGEPPRTVSIATAGAPLLGAEVDRHVLRDDHDDLAFVTIELRDAGGRLVTDADRLVEVTVIGDASLVGMCSADPRATTAFGASTWPTFDGRALAVIRPDSAGRAIVTVSSDGLDEVRLEIAIEEHAAA